MGRIVRRFARFYELEMRGNVKIGEWTATEFLGITQYEAGQRLLEVFLEATALGGAARGAYIACQATVAVAAVLGALHARMQVPTGITVTGSTYGLHIEQEITGTGVITGTMEGIRMELYSPGTTTIASAYGMFMTNYVDSNPTGDYAFFRLTENGNSVVRSAFDIRVGGAADITNLFNLPGNPTAWDAATPAAGASTGRIAVLVAGVQLYLQLWTA